MKWLLALATFLACLNFTYGQETERKVKRSQNGDKEEFHVLKTNNNISGGLS